jgi:hypothetical protein
MAVELLKKALTPYAIPYEKRRFGRQGDGGYVVFMHRLEEIADVFSYGINDDVSFDLDFTKYSNAQIHMFDHTISSLPTYHRQFKLYKEPGSLGTCIKHITDITSNHSSNKRNKLFLKMDIEGHEWNIFKYLPMDFLTQFEQMVIEFHNLEFMQNHVFGFIDLTQADMAAVFERINSQFYLGHIHGNNCGGIKDVPNTIECTYIRKDLVEGVPSVETVPYPIENLDFKNNVYISDYPLRWWL